MIQHEAYLDAILRERPYRAVDRIFSQHRTEQVLQIYNFLQSKLRTNTNELRQTLYRKYENLINCSQMLQNLNHYSQNIQHFSNKIQQILTKDYSENHSQSQPLGVIAQIQQLIFKKKFLQAMQFCSKYQQKQQFNEENYFMAYMPVQIIQKMQNYLTAQCLSKQNILVYIQVVKLFLINKNQAELREIAIGMKAQSLLSIISYSYKDQLRNSQQSLDRMLLNCLFQFKMKTLSHCQSDSKIFDFFNSLLEIASTQLINKTYLSQIFMKEMQFVHKNLVLIFIDDSGSLLNFQYDMYEDLMSSEEFKNIVNELEKRLGLSQSNVIMKQFQNLWENYLISVIDYFEEQLNPLKYIQALLPKQQIKKDAPSEYEEFIVDKMLQEGLRIRANYRNYLQSYKSVIGDLYKKGNKEQINQIIIKKMGNINLKLKQKLNSIQMSKHLIKLFIIVRWLCEDYNTVNNLQIQTNINMKLDPQLQPSKILTAFINPGQSLQCNMIQFDIFFLQMVGLNNSKDDIQLLRYLILSILQCWKQQQTAHKHKIQGLIQRLTKKKQILSLYRCLVPGIAENIFYLDLQADEKIIDMSIFGKYIQKIEENNQKPAQQSMDVDFDIGEMQAPQDMIKVGMKSVGNIILGLKGFMPKRK